MLPRDERPSTGHRHEAVKRHPYSEPQARNTPTTRDNRNSRDSRDRPVEVLQACGLLFLPYHEKSEGWQPKKREVLCTFAF